MGEKNQKIRPFYDCILNNIPLLHSTLRPIPVGSDQHRDRGYKIQGRPQGRSV